MPSIQQVRLAIAIPTYNEAKNLKPLLTRLKSVLAKSGVSGCTVLIIDDNSPDGTGRMAEQLARKLKTKRFKVSVLHRKEKRGLGSAYRAGFAQLIGGDFSHILQMDADLSHDPRHIPNFLKGALQSDFVVGSRYISGGGTPDWQLYRILISRLGNWYARCWLGGKIHDFTGGYNLYTAALLEGVDINSLRSEGYGFLIELKYRALIINQSAYEVPIVFKDRTHGKSKLPRSTLFTNFLIVPRLRLKNTALAQLVPKAVKR